MSERKPWELVNISEEQWCREIDKMIADEARRKEQGERWRRKAGYVVGVATPPKTERNAAIVADLKAGMRVKDVAAKYDLSSSRVISIRDRYG